MKTPTSVGSGDALGKVVRHTDWASATDAHARSAALVDDDASSSDDDDARLSPSARHPGPGVRAEAGVDQWTLERRRVLPQGPRRLCRTMYERRSWRRSRPRRVTAALQAVAPAAALNALPIAHAWRLEGEPHERRARLLNHLLLKATRRLMPPRPAPRASRSAARTEPTLA